MSRLESNLGMRWEGVKDGGLHSPEVVPAIHVQFGAARNIPKPVMKSSRCPPLRKRKLESPFDKEPKHAGFPCWFLPGEKGYPS